MSQVRTGTVDVTNGSQVVTGSGTNWLTSTKINDLFIIQGESVIYRIASVVSDTQISLSSDYVGATATGVAYVIHVDFTTSGIPLMQDGDIETVSIYNLAVVALEQGLSSGTYYLGAFTTAPTSTGTGGAITQGMMYFDTSLDLLRVYDGSAWYDGAASANAAAQSAAEAAADAVQTGLDRVQTGLDRVQTVSDAAQTISDAAQTAADRVQTGLDRVQTVSDAAQTVLDAAATAADRVQTGLDATATAADRVDVNGVETRVLAIEVSINNTFDTFDDRFLGTFTTDPTHDNDGNPISVGAVYYNSVELATKFYNGSSWDDPSQSASTSATNALNSENAAAASALDASTSASEALASEGAASTSESNAASSAADALASFNEFVDIYHGALSSAPTTNLNAGDLYFDIPTSAMRVYDGALWRAVTTVVEGVYAVAEYTNIATQTTITIAYDVGLVQVLYNGVQLNLGDFTATNGTSILLTVAVVSATDVITVIRWGAVTTSTFLGTAATKNTGVTTGTLPFAEDVVLIQPSGNVGIGTTSPNGRLGVTGGTTNASTLLTAYDNAAVTIVPKSTSGYSLAIGSGPSDFPYLQMSASGTAPNALNLNPYGGNVGIGTSSPKAQLEISGAPATYNFSAGTDPVVNAAIISDNVNAGTGAAIVLGSVYSSDYTVANARIFAERQSTGATNAGATDLIFEVGQAAGSALAERLRIDSSGNLLVGKTALDVGVVGHELRESGYSASTRDGSTVGSYTRLNSDGTILEFRKDSTSVGSIGTASSYIYLSNSDTGIALIGGTDRIAPVNGTGGIRDAAIDLGYSGGRFKDLYLSGNATMTQLRAVGVSGVAQEQFMGAINGVSNGYQINSTTGNAITYKWHTGANSNAMTLDSSGNLLVGTTGVLGASLSTGKVQVLNTNAAGHGASFQTNATSGYAAGAFARNSNTGPVCEFFHNPSASAVGKIIVDSTSTVYATSSDYRLKEDDLPMTGATERVKALRPVNFAWKADGTRVDGFFAHEVQEVVPEAATGAKDAMMDEEYEVTPAVIDAEGNETEAAVMGTRSVPDYQGIDQSKLVPLLTATIQELIARIEILEAK